MNGTSPRLPTTEIAGQHGHTQRDGCYPAGLRALAAGWRAPNKDEEFYHQAKKELQEALDKDNQSHKDNRSHPE